MAKVNSKMHSNWKHGKTKKINGKVKMFKFDKVNNYF